MAEHTDHDARPDGPGVNSPGNEPDAGSAKEHEESEAGRFSGEDLDRAQRVTGGDEDTHEENA